jgi:hypothetical protein
MISDSYLFLLLLILYMYSFRFFPPKSPTELSVESQTVP